MMPSASAGARFVLRPKSHERSSAEIRARGSNPAGQAMGPRSPPAQLVDRYALENRLLKKACGTPTRTTVRAIDCGARLRLEDVQRTPHSEGPSLTFLRAAAG